MTGTSMTVRTIMKLRVTATIQPRRRRTSREGRTPFGWPRRPESGVVIDSKTSKGMRNPKELSGCGIHLHHKVIVGSLAIFPLAVCCCNPLVMLGLRSP